MSERTERAALVTLLRSGRRPWQIYADEIEEAGSALAVLDQERTLHRGQTSLLDDPNDDDLLSDAATDIAAWEARSFTLLTVLDRDYPENLRTVHDRPPLIFVAGALRPNDTRSIAVIGTRQPTPQGVGQARHIAEHLTATGYTVTSGLANGIDTAAHTAALKNGRTTAVIGTGLAHAYPATNASLQHTIATTGAVVSQFWPDTPPARRNFPMRNAVMSGMTLATVVVEALHRSGARIQARVALAHGRPVFLARRLISDQEWAKEFASRPNTFVFDDPALITETIERLTAPGALTG